MSPARVGLLGDPVAHSRSPAMMNAALRATGIEGDYVAERVSPAALAETLSRLRDGGWRGLNLTVPHKVTVLRHLDAVERSGVEVGAVNTLLPGDRGWIGTNTDVDAVRELLRRSGVRGDAAVVLGTGGAARACVSALRAEGFGSITVVGRDAERAEALCDGFRGGGAELRSARLGDEATRDALSRADVVLQATSAGMDGGPAPGALIAGAPLEVCPSGALAFDLVYAPRETSWMTAARAAGLRVVRDGGLEMLALQGAAAFARWFHRPAPLEVMRSALGLAGVFSTE